tara:strand:+ start:1118 stop:1666 length:549 start_codon:yes stop_codon:yes gene_type:complete
MISKIISRALSILKLEKNTYKEITQDKSSFIYSSTIIFLAALINVYLFGKYVNPMLPIKIPLMSIFLVWLLFNWCLFSFILNIVANLFTKKKNKKNFITSINLVGFSYTPELLKILIILLPNFIKVISWGALMLVLASQVIGVKETYKIEKLFISIGTVFLSYISQIFIIVSFVVIFTKLSI